METTIIFIRHGSIVNPGDVVYGRLPGFHLSDLGRRQASSLAKALKERGIKFDRIYTSPLERAIDSARILIGILGHSPVFKREELNDVDGPIFEGEPMDVLRGMNFRYYTPELIAKGVESPENQRDRTAGLVYQTIEEHPGETVGFVGHGDPLRFCFGGVVDPDGLPDLSRLRDDDYLGPGEAMILTFDGIRLLEYEHLRPEMPRTREKDITSRFKEA